MTFVVAGGGFAGVETVGAINDFLRDTLQYYPELDPSILRVLLVHPGEFVLPELGEKLGQYTQERLRRRGVEVLLQTRVAGYQNEEITFVNGDPVGAMTLIWTAGVKPAAAVEALAVEKVRGRIKVSQCLEVPGYEGVVWAVGDCAAIPDGNGRLQPPTAQHGMRAAVAAAKNILASLDESAPAPFRFSTIGLLASIGHHTGVAQIFGVRFSGFIAWWLWRSVYLTKLPRLSKKLRVAIKWSLDLFFPREIEQLVTLRDVEHVEKLSARLRTMRSGPAPTLANAAQTTPTRGGL